VRCHKEIKPKSEHLCADVAARLARRERQVQAVLAIVPMDRPLAEQIVKVLSNLGVEND
jgi:hypothetical protein